LSAGYETVYDFATMERAKFYFQTQPLSEDIGFTGVGTGIFETGISAAYVHLHNFASWRNIETDYSGRFDGFLAGLNSSPLQLGEGIIEVWAPGERAGEVGVTGKGIYFLFGLGVDAPLPPVSYVRLATEYTLKGQYELYTTTGTETGYVTEIEMERMQQDILNGNHLPSPFDRPLKRVADFLGSTQRGVAANNLRQVWDQNKDYFTKHFPICRTSLPLIVK
jgi:hypothetical protein